MARATYIGETRRKLVTKLKEQQEVCRKRKMEKSAVVEHAWKDQHTIKWEEATGCSWPDTQRLVAQGSYPHANDPAEKPLNRDTRPELSGCPVKVGRHHQPMSDTHW